MLKQLGLFLICSVFLVSIGINRVEALQEVAGPIEFDVKPGETKMMQWGLVSDENNSTVLKITASGPGSELLSFSNTIDMPAHKLIFVDITVTVPTDHPNNVQLNPSIYATQGGKPGSNVILNLQVQKVITIKIGTPPTPTTPPTVPEFGPIAELVLAIAVVSIIVVSVRTAGLRFIPTRT